MTKSKFTTALELFWVFFKIGLFTFGGGLAMISLISREVVDEKKWINDKEMGDIVIIAESTPGAIAVNTATFVGYKTAGVFGALMATLGVTLPSLIIISIIYIFFDLFKGNKWFNAAFKGIRAGVIVLLVNAVLKLFKPMDKTAITLTASALTFLLVLFVELNTIWIILAGGVIGAVWFVVRASLAKRRVPTAEGAGQVDSPQEVPENAQKQQDEEGEQ